MSTALVTHSDSLELITILKSTSIEATSRTPLNFPTRYQSTTTTPTTTTPKPQTTISPTNGHVHLYSKHGSTIWEYDSRGRRVGEMSFGKGKTILKACCMGAGVVGGGRERVAVCLGHHQIQIMEKGEGNKWAPVEVFENAVGVVSMIVDGERIITGQDNGELVVYQQDGRVTIPIPKDADLERIVLTPSMESTIVIPLVEPCELLVVSLSSPSRIESSIRKVTPFAHASGGRVAAICFSPVVSTAGVQRSGLCAVLRSGVERDEVALIGLDTPDSAPKLVSFGYPMTSLVFLDGTTLAGACGKSLFVKRLRALTDRPVEYPLDEPILDLEILPALSKTRSSTSTKTIPTSITTSARTALSETRHISNNIIETPVPMPSKTKGKATEMVHEKRVTITASLERGDEKVVQVVHSTSDKRLRAPVGRFTSGPSSLRDLPSNQSTKNQVTASSTATATDTSSKEPSPMADIPEDAEHDQDSNSLDLGWALRPPASRSDHQSLIGDPTPTESESIQIMRRDLANLQLDMLRMGRGLKNEIRKAILPVMEELKESRAVIEKQRREIDRLRRGF